MKGVKPDRYGLRVYVKVGKLQKETREFKPGTERLAEKIKAWQDQARVELRKRAGAVTVKGTLRADAKRYLEHMKATLAKSSYASRVCEINAWLPELGDMPRHKITRDQILDVRKRWLTDEDEPRAAKTCNHRTRALKHLYRYLDGKAQPTPLDDVQKLEEPPAAPQFVDVRVIKRVAAKLSGKTRGRFMVLASTGQRPAQLKRAQPGDVDLRRGIWMVRPAKGGNPIPVILTDDMKAAWRVFIAADAWSQKDEETGELKEWDGSDYAKELYAAGWPKHIRPYNAKHTVAIALANDGAEWEDIKDWFGHTDIKTTRIYTGQVLNRLRKTSEKLSGRIGW